MNFFVFTVVVLIAIQGAYAIKCYQCAPNSAEIINATKKGNFSGMNLCSNPTESVDCSQDPDIGSIADTCYTTSVAMNISLADIGEIKYHLQGCVVKSMCKDVKKTTCDALESTFAGTPGIGISLCDVSCCESDLCNNPSRPPATTPPASSVKSTHPPASSVKSTHVPPNAAMFGILGLVTLAFMSSF